MKVNNQNKLHLIIKLLDTHLINELKKKDVNVLKVQSITGVRTEFIEELNNVKRGENIRDMFDKKYFENFRKS